MRLLLGDRGTMILRSTASADLQGFSYFDHFLLSCSLLRRLGSRDVGEMGAGT